MKELLDRIYACQTCAEFLPFAPNPVINVSVDSKILLIGQAPGLAVHQSNIPWDDKSGDRLREWMQVDKKDFYNADKIGIVPMGFCYPGKGKSGDLPPRKECAPQWHQALFKQMPQIKHIILVGKYAQDYYLEDTNKKTLTETVRNFEEYLPKYMVLPHPSPRNNIWMAKNPWFQEYVLPKFQAVLKEIL